MICHRYKTIFVHIPKTAGQSIEHVFLEKMELNWATRAPLLLRYNSEPKLGPERLAHLYATEYVSLGHIAPIDFADYFKFSIVRNPWDRLVSFYKRSVLSSGVSFREFVINGFPKVDHTAFGRQVAPQWYYLMDDDDNLLVDSIVKFEQLEEDLFPILKRIFGDDAPLAIPKVNASSNRTDPASFYDERTYSFVQEFYAKDIKFFGY